jgi:hypothetical protein
MQRSTPLKHSMGRGGGGGMASGRHRYTMTWACMHMEVASPLRPLQAVHTTQHPSLSHITSWPSALLQISQRLGQLSS